MYGGFEKIDDCKENNLKIEQKRKIFIEPNEKLEFHRISKPTFEEYEVARKNDMPKLGSN